MTTNTYAGHTLAEIKALAEAASAERKYGSSGLHGLETWARDGCRVERDLAAHIRDLQAIPATALSMAARLDGWKAAREQAAKLCDDHATDRWNLYKGRPPYAGDEDGRAHQQTQGENIGAEFCAEAIRAMQQPAEWGDMGIPISAPAADWPHPDGFAGGMMGG